MTVYLVDSNVFIQAKNLHYGFDFCPAFWDWLIEQKGAGRAVSIEKVADELQAGDDELAEWAAARRGGFFLPPDAGLVSPERAPEFERGLSSAPWDLLFLLLRRIAKRRHNLNVP